MKGTVIDFVLCRATHINETSCSYQGEGNPIGATIILDDDRMIVWTTVSTLEFRDVINENVVFPVLEGWNQRISQVRDVQTLMNNNEYDTSCVSFVNGERTPNDLTLTRTEIGGIYVYILNNCVLLMSWSGCSIP
jgi:hypothetical protein